MEKNKDYYSPLDIPILEEEPYNYGTSEVRGFVTCETRHSKSVPNSEDEAFTFVAGHQIDNVPHANIEDGVLSMECNSSDCGNRKRKEDGHEICIGKDESCLWQESKRVKKDIKTKYRDFEPLGPGESSSRQECNEFLFEDIQRQHKFYQKKYSRDEILKLQEVRNILKAGYMEVMSKALKAGTWITRLPALGSIDELVELFHSPALPGTRVECTTACAKLPIEPLSLVFFLMSQVRWEDAYGPPPACLLHLLEHSDVGLMQLALVTKDTFLPTPWGPTQKFQFLRFVRPIQKDMWAVIDISIDYFQDTNVCFASGAISRRRPSGVIIRKCGLHSEVIWIENVEVRELQVQHNLFSPKFFLNWAYCAKRRLTFLSNTFNQSNSRFVTVKMPLHSNAFPYLMHLSEGLRMLYLSVVKEFPDEQLWDIVSNQEVRVMRGRTQELASLGCFVAQTTFSVRARPNLVFNFIAEKNWELLWHIIFDNEPEEWIKLATEDNSGCITLYIDQGHKAYLFQDASRDDFVSYIISSTMHTSDVNYPICYGGSPENFNPSPSGFAIMPNGSGGLDADASVVTISLQGQFDVQEVEKAIQHMTIVIHTIIAVIKERLEWSGVETS